MSRIIPRDLIKHLEWTPGQTPPQPRQTGGGSPGNSGASTNPSIQSSADFWSISGVQYRNGVYTVDVMKSLLDSGNAKKQDDWVALYDAARDKNEFHIPDYPLLYGVIRSLYSLRDDAVQEAEVTEAHKFLKDTSRAKWLMTSTCIKYQSSEDDLIVHNYGTRDAYEERAAFMGVDKKIEASDSAALYQKLLGTSDETSGVLDVFKWLNGTDTYIYRVNARPATVDERVAGFGADSVWVGLGCYGVPANSGAGLGVRLSRAP